MDLLYALFLGIIQGATEWLPVSSSAHLAIAQKHMGEGSVAFDVMLHVATLLVVLIAFRKDVFALIREFFAFLGDAARGGRPIKDVMLANPERKLLFLIILASVPTALIGAVMNFYIGDIFESLAIIGAALIVTGVILFLTRGAKRVRGMSAGGGAAELNKNDALIIGVAQGCALIPGLSRSGLTISTGILRGISDDLAARFSFLLSIPAVMGAVAIQYKDINALASADMLPIISGMAAAFVFGYIFIVALMKLINKKQFHNFAYYCWIAGAITLLAYAMNW